MAHLAFFNEWAMLYVALPALSCVATLLSAAVGWCIAGGSPRNTVAVPKQSVARALAVAVGRAAAVLTAQQSLAVYVCLTEHSVKDLGRVLVPFARDK